MFAFSGVFWVLSAWLSFPGAWTAQRFSFVNPGVLATPPSLWLKADAGVTVNTGGVSYWRDQSGNGHHAYQPEDDYRPERLESYLNFNPVLDFGGADEFIYGSAGFSTQTFFIVAYNDERFRSANSGQALLSFGGNGNNYFGLGRMTSLVNNEFISFGIIQDTTYRAALTGDGNIPAGPHLFASWRNTGAAGPRQMIQVNGRTTVNTEYNPDGYAWADDEEYMIAGKLNSNGSVRDIFNGKVAEVIAFDAPLGKFDRAKVQSYLAIKYGLTLDQEHPDPDLRAYYDANANVIWDPARTPGYDQDIAGIGQDDRSGLNQLRSKSVNEGSLLTVGMPTDLNDGEFLVWANDGQGLEFSPAGAPTGYRRLARTWRVQEIGDLGAVELTGLGTHFVIDREGDGFADNNPVSMGTAVNLNDGDRLTFLVEEFEQCGAPGGVAMGLYSWLRADAGLSTTSSGAVNYWEDYSGNGHFLGQSESDRQPTILAEELNFNPVLNFDKANRQFLEGPAGGFSTRDYFVVFAPGEELYAGGVGGTLLGAEAGGTRFDFGYNGFTFALDNELLFHSIDFGVSYSSGLTSDRRIIDSFFPYIANPKDKEAGDGTEIYFNGLPIANASSGTFTSLEADAFTLGASISGSRAYNGSIAEVIVYDRRNSAEDRRRIQSYLALKYGITLDQTAANETDRHYYDSAGDIIWDARRNRDYAEDIAGIGRDAGSCWLQAKSQSQNPDGILRIGAADISEGAFLVWGNSGEPLTESALDGGPAGFLTLSRVWRAQETGETGDLEIAFANGALGKSNGAGYFLVVDTDNDASFADESPVPFLFDGEEFSLSGVDLNDGNRFTIAVNCAGTTVVAGPIREEYYLPAPENQFLEVLQTIYPSAEACNRTLTTRVPRAPTFNYTSITTQGAGTVIIYDHWEDGFEPDLENPQQPSTETWGDGNPANGYPPGFPCDIILADAIVLNEAIDPDVITETYQYDGGDRLGASGPVAITKANWSEGGRTLFAGAVEVFATDFWSEDYVVPFGENVVTATQSFQYVGALIMARDDNTEVAIDENGDGAPEQTVTLNQGQSHLVNGGLRTGARIAASAPVQVHLVTGDICDNFESRWFSLPGSDITCDAYYSAVADNSVMYYFFNPNNTSILVKHETPSGARQDFLIPANGYTTKYFSTPDREGHHFYTENGRKFYAAFFYSINDYTRRGSAFDWGATLVCEDLLPRSLQVGWAYGQDPLLPRFENGSPLWVTAAYPTGSESSGPISVCVDFNGDNAGPFSEGDRNYDLLLSLEEYEAVRIFDPDGDQTGTIISICDGSDAILSVHWGADQDAASASQPGLDLGTGIPFTLPYYVDKLAADQDGDGLFQAGEEVIYTIEVSPLGQNTLGGPFLIRDELPAQVRYLPGTAEVIRPDGSIVPLADDAAGQTPFPLDEEGQNIGAGDLIQPGETMAVRFSALIELDAAGEITNRAVVRQGIYERADEVAIEVNGRVKTFDLALVKRVDANLTPGPYRPGSPVSFEIEVFNQGESAAFNVEIVDYLPQGLRLNDGLWTVDNGQALRVIPGPIPPGGSETIVIDYIVEEGIVGLVDNFAEISAADDDLDQNNEPPEDQDSQYDRVPDNDAGGRPDSPADDAMDGDGDGIPGDADPATDADDHDGARVEIQPVFDLALRKRLDTGVMPGPFTPGDFVTFRIELFNQGTLDAQAIQINDYLPAGLTLADPDWTEVEPGRAQLNTPVATLPAGAQTQVDIRLRIEETFAGTSLINRAEIAGAGNALDLPDKDSQPDNDPANDAGGQPQSPADDYLAGDGTGAPGDGVAASDEDDHDPAEVVVGQTFDLALTKVLGPETPGPFMPGDFVTFRIELFNQGTLDAQNIQINDYLPTGLALADPNWTEVASGRAQLNNPVAMLPAGAQAQIDIRLRIEENFTGTSLTNRAEIAAASNALGLADEDSQPDNDPANDAGGQPQSPADDYLNGDGSGAPGDGVAASDEDDYDPARIVVGQVFDLALVKRLDTEATPGPFRAGDPVRFRIEVINQGTRPAEQITITDYLPDGLLLADDEWTADGPLAIYTIDQPIAANGGSTSITIDLTVAPDFMGATLVNRAEISAADDDSDPDNAPPVDVDSPYDQNPDNDAGGAPGSPADNAVGGNGQGDIGGTDPATDEDDADAALITLCTSANAGEDGVADVCTGCGTGPVYVDLFASLGGSPDAGGFWTDLSGTGVDLQNPRQVDFAGATPGMYRFRYAFDEDTDCGIAAEVTVEVSSYAAMACNDRVNLSFGENCSIQVQPDLLLEGSVKCPADYEVRLYDEAGRFLGDVITGEQAGQVITAEVYNLTCGTSCSATLRIDDRVAPRITCPEMTVDLICSDADTIFNNPASLPITGEPSVTDNCSADYDLQFIDTRTEDGDCGLISIARRFTVADPSGNESSCLQLINIRRPGLGDVTPPPAEVRLDCEDLPALDGNGNPHPSVTGFPEVTTQFGTFPLDQVYCNLGASYNDSEPIEFCAGSYSVVRTWTLVDWCAANNPTMDFTQLINIEDNAPPTVVCTSDTLEFSTGPFDCTATLAVPMPEITDNCTDWTVDVEVVTDVEVLVYDRFGRVIDTVLETRVLATAPAGTNFVTGIPTGCHRFRYTVRDACDNIAIKECAFCVRDENAPVAVCDPNLEVSLGGGGVGRLTAEDLNEGSWDNCGLASIQIRRAVIRNENCVATAETYTEWSDAIFTNCCDLGLETIVELLVIDSSGNRNTCRANLQVADRINPNCQAPPAATISCGDLPLDFAPEDTLVLQALFGEAGVSDNCGGTGTRELPPVIDLTDCGSGVITRVFEAFDGQGNVSTNTCRQVVTIEPYNEYEIQFPADVAGSCSDEVAPAVVINGEGCDDLGVSVVDETYTDIPGICSRTLRRYRIINWCTYDGSSDPVVIGRDEDCDDEGGDEPVWILHRNGTTYIDRDNDEGNATPAAGAACSPANPGGYWRTIASVGFWQYTQHIDVIDETETQVQFEETSPFCTEANACTGAVALPFTVTSNCEQLDFQVAVDENNDGVIDRRFEAGSAISGTFPEYVVSVELPVGEHVIELRLEDGCGETTVVRLPCTVVDCQAPVLACLPEVSVDLAPLEEDTDVDGDGDIDLGAIRLRPEDLLTAEATDCSGPVRYSIHFDWETPDSSQTELILTCDNADTALVRIYAWDAADNPYAIQPDGQTGGVNYGFCETVVLIQDTLYEACTPRFPGRVSGLIMTEEDNAVENVIVDLSGPQSVGSSTDITGAYLFENLEEGYDYTITPNLDTDHRNGVTTFDLTIIEKHILGTRRMDSPYKLIAADVNRSGTITVFDIIKIRQLILTEIDEFDNNTSWRFVRADHEFPDPENPFATFIPEVITINDLFGQVVDGDFVGIKTGDVNHSAIANSNMGSIPRALTDTLFFKVQDRWLRAGEVYEASFFIPDLEAVEGYQYTLELDLDRVRLEEVAPGAASALHFGRRYISEGLLTTSWHRTAATVRPNGDPVRMYTLSVKALADGWLSESLRISSRLTRAESYNRVGETQAVALTYERLDETMRRPQLYQNQPNPFEGQTVIRYTLPKATRIHFAVYDLWGREIYAEEGPRPAGAHEVRLDRGQLSQSGVYYYRLTTDRGFRASRKMVFSSGE